MNKLVEYSIERLVNTVQEREQEVNNTISFINKKYELNLSDVVTDTGDKLSELGTIIYQIFPYCTNYINCINWYYGLNILIFGTKVKIELRFEEKITGKILDFSIKNQVDLSTIPAHVIDSVLRKLLFLPTEIERLNHFEKENNVVFTSKDEYYEFVNGLLKPDVALAPI